MPITRSSDQPSKTLEEFYTQIGEDNEVSQLIGQDMLAFIRMINETFLETPLWGLTSMARLVIQAEDSWMAPWYVIVSALAGEFYFEYLLSAAKAPWEDATVKGTAKSLQQAKQYLLIAMHESGGWKENAELQKLLAEFV